MSPVTIRDGPALTSGAETHSVTKVPTNHSRFGRFFHKLQYFRQLGTDFAVIFPAMGPQAIGAVLDSLLRICKIAAAPVA